MDSFKILNKNDFDSVLSVIPFNVPFQRALKMGFDNRVNFFYSEFSSTRSQDLEQCYHDAGQFYWMNTKICLQKERIITDNTGTMIISAMEGQDMDNEIDWKLAELKYQLLQSNK